MGSYIFLEVLEGIIGKSFSILQAQASQWLVYTDGKYTHKHASCLEPFGTACLPQPSMEGIYPPNQGMLSNLFTSLKFRPDRRTPRRVDGSRTIAETWVKDLHTYTHIAKHATHTHTHTQVFYCNNVKLLYYHVSYCTVQNLMTETIVNCQREILMIKNLIIHC